jgi:hypothetical protein
MDLKEVEAALDALVPHQHGASADNPRKISYGAYLHIDRRPGYADSPNAYQIVAHWDEHQVAEGRGASFDDAMIMLKEEMKKLGSPSLFAR